MYFIGVDAGTTVIKGVLYSAAEGRVTARAERRVAYRASGLRVEFDPEAHYADLCGLLRELGRGGKVAALAMAAASGNTLLLHPDGSAATPVISWLDRRSGEGPLPMLDGLTPEYMRRITGWPCVEEFPPAHLAWLAEHCPELYRDCLVGQSQEYLAWKLTGRRVLDPSGGTPFELIDQLERDYSAELLDRFHLRREQLPELVETGRAIGRLTPRAAADTGLGEETMVVAGSFDHPAAARAAGVTGVGELLLSCGTSWVGFFPEPSRERIVELELLCDPFLAHAGGPWGAIFSVPQIGRTVDEYVRRDFGDVAGFDRLAALSTTGEWLDLTAGYRPSEAARPDLARMVMNGAAHLLAERLDALRRRGLVFTRARLAGGPSRSPVWPAIIADFTRLEVDIAAADAGATGAALIAMEGIR